VSFAAITVCVASQRVFIVVIVYFVIDSVRKLLDTPSDKKGIENVKKCYVNCVGFCSGKPHALEVCFLLDA
jgi:hypothetical protein